jgi:hypothetical protein
MGTQASRVESIKDKLGGKIKRAIDRFRGAARRTEEKVETAAGEARQAGAEAAERAKEQVEQKPAS